MNLAPLSHVKQAHHKALLPFGDCCLIEYLVRKFQPDFPKIYLSVQQKNDYAHLNLPVTTIGDIYGNAGPLSGIFSALSMISEERAFFISVDTGCVNVSVSSFNDFFGQRNYIF